MMNGDSPTRTRESVKYNAVNEAKGTSNIIKYEIKIFN